ncbi:hypothetical protein BJV82DRAFT_630234 [Fennellomyces sp. T-0311]|nr:hypothetical protein BJV82DRAFT_630234 [Fennellomyces sp. T-0311]
MFLNHLLVVLALWAAVAHALPRPKDGFCWKKIDTFFVFGDSYTSVVGPLGTPGFTWNNFTTPGAVYNDAILLNQTTAGGPNWPQYLTNCYAGLPQHCRLHLYDIAFAGATIDDALVARHHDYTVTFVEQIEQWKTRVEHAIHWDPKKTLTGFWIGINDVSDTKAWTNISYPAFYNELVEVYFDSVSDLYTRGMRSFLFFNVPPRERSPSGGDASYAKIIRIYNTILDEHIAAFKSSHTDANVISINAWELFNSYLDNAAELGFKDITTFCPNSTAPDINSNYEAYGCLAPYEYFWIDSGHPTYPVHRLLADSVEQQLEDSSRC